MRIDRTLVANALASAPKTITLRARNAEHDVPVSGVGVAFAPTSCPPNVMDIQGGRRTGTLHDYCNGIKLCQSFEVTHMLGAYTEPQEIEVNLRQLGMIRVFGCSHTLERYREAFYAPLVSEWRNYESWKEAGSKNATDRAHAIWKATLDQYVAPPRDPTIVEAIEAFVQRRTSEGRAPPSS